METWIEKNRNRFEKVFRLVLFKNLKYNVFDYSVIKKIAKQNPIIQKTYRKYVYGCSGNNFLRYSGAYHSFLSYNNRPHSWLKRLCKKGYLKRESLKNKNKNGCHYEYRFVKK